MKGLVSIMNTSSSARLGVGTAYVPLRRCQRASGKRSVFCSAARAAHDTTAMHERCHVVAAAAAAEARTTARVRAPRTACRLGRECGPPPPPTPPPPPPPTHTHNTHLPHAAVAAASGAAGQRARRAVAVGVRVDAVAVVVVAAWPCVYGRVGCAVSGRVGCSGRACVGGWGAQ
jgi:hypothetical protein